MRKMFAIARVSLRNAIRAKAVICLITILMALIIGIPLTVKGDGSVGSIMHIVVTYSLGMAAFMIALTSLWAGSASIAVEITDKTAQMIITKPVSTWQLWMGKWIGLNIMNAALLAMCGLITYALLQWTLRPANLPHPLQHDEATRLFSARERLIPNMPDVAAKAQQELEQRRSRGEIAEEISPAALLNDLIRQKRITANMVAAGQSNRWVFGAVDTVKTPAALSLRYRFSSSSIGQSPVAGTWIVRAGDQELLRTNRVDTPRNRYEFSWTAESIAPGEPISVTFANNDDDGTAVIFDVEDGLSLLIPRGSFTANYLRSMLIIFGHLSIMAALGVTAGSLFSLPVATFVSLSFLVVIQMGGYIQSVAQDPSAPGRLTGVLFMATAALLKPFFTTSPLESISTGILINTGDTLYALLWQGIVVSIILGTLAAGLMRRREFALPSN